MIRINLLPAFDQFDDALAAVAGAKINAQVISKGRYGRTKEIKLMVPNNVMDKIKEILGNSLGI